MMRQKLASTALLIILGSFVIGGVAFGQDRVEDTITPLDVELTFSTYDGDEATERLPYKLLVNAETNGTATELRMGIEVPVTGREGNIQYRNVGTNISCRAQPAANGRYLLSIQIERSSFVSENTPRNSLHDNPPFRSLSGEHRVILSDGETVELSSATDPVNGQRSTVEVAMHIKD